VRLGRLGLMSALAFVCAVVLAGPALAKPPADSDCKGGRPLSTTLTGAAERPGPGDPDGSGTANVRVNPGQECISYDITVQEIEPATAAHIHVGEEDEAGPVVVGLAPPTSGSSSGTANVNRELAKDIVQNPEEYYVNVHNLEFQAGAVRGQLSK
jgi:CHRD domain-containing protein